MDLIEENEMLKKHNLHLKQVIKDLREDTSDLLKAFEAGRCLSQEDWEEEDILDWETFLENYEIKISSTEG